MKFFKSVAAAVACTALAAAFTACSGSEESSSAESRSASQTTASQSAADIQIKSYEFPGFLSEISPAEPLSTAVYTSFNEAQLLVEPETQPFEGYKCTAVFGDSYYIFKDDDGYGLLSYGGTVIIPSEGVEKISPVSSNILHVSYSDGTNSYFITDGIGIERMVLGDFDSSRIAFDKRVSEDGSQEYSVLTLDGEEIYDAHFTSVIETDVQEVGTSLDCAAIYSAVSGGEEYYIVFDKFYNLTVYRAPYGFVKLKIGGEYGECYILDSDDYAELETLVSSFGRESHVSAPSKDESSDYIQITLGLSGSESRVLTLSSDGYCLTDNISADGEATNKFFAVMSKETFTDLVDWVNLTLGEEYSE